MTRICDTTTELTFCTMAFTPILSQKSVYATEKSSPYGPGNNFSFIFFRLGAQVRYVPDRVEGGEPLLDGVGCPRRLLNAHRAGLRSLSCTAMIWEMGEMIVV